MESQSTQTGRGAAPETQASITLEAKTPAASTPTDPPTAAATSRVTPEHFSPSRNIPYSAAVVMETRVPDSTTDLDITEVAYSFGDPDAIAAIKVGRLQSTDLTIPLESGTGSSAFLVLRPAKNRSTADILVVDDDPISAAYYADALQPFGIRVHIASTGIEANEMARTRSFSLLLIDVRLPDINGFELCRSLASAHDIAHPPMIMMSADPALADDRTVASVGAAGFIVNPIDPAELVRRVLAELRETDDESHTRQVRVSKATTSIRLQLFGRPQIVVNNSSIMLPRGRSTEIIATLAAVCPSAISADLLGRSVWAEAEDPTPNATYTAISRLRSFLSSVGAGDLVQSDNDGYYLGIPASEIDVVAFETRSTDVPNNGGLSVDAAKKVLSEWTGIGFPVGQNPILRRWVQRLVERRSRICEDLAIAQIRAGDPASAIIVCRDLVTEEPWREFVWALLIVALYRCGRSNDALAAFSHAKRTLLEELGLDPGPTLNGLELMVLTHDERLFGDQILERGHFRRDGE